jgi:hypothetical protein
VAPPPPPSSSTLNDSKHQDILDTWKDSKHGNTFVLSIEGLNNGCADCHSPLNWLPTDKADLPKSCQSCKVPFELKEPTEPVSEADWMSIECNICHMIDAEGVVSQVSWYSATRTMPGEDAIYDAISSTNELCEKCHKDTDTSLYGRDLGTSLHIDKQCIDCHDAHSQKASCSNCHTEPILKHDEEHAIVECTACHDASGLNAGPVEGENIWLTFRDDDPYISHNLQLEVDCARCHYADNSWGLSVITE